MQTLNNPLHALRLFFSHWFLPLLALVVGLLGTPAYAQTTPAGAWFGRVGAPGILLRQAHLPATTTCAGAPPRALAGSRY